MNFITVERIKRILIKNTYKFNELNVEEKEFCTLKEKDLHKIYDLLEKIK